MQQTQLTVEKRTVFGKKLKTLRKQGLLAANIYGKGVKSLAIQVPLKTFQSVYKKVGETGLVDLQVDGQTRPVLIHNVQIDHLSLVPLHADFFQVNLKEKVKTMVPLTLIGEAKAVTDKLGLAMQPLSEVEVEALPADLPDHIEVDVTPLAAVDEQITVKDLSLPTGVTVLTDAEQVVVKIAELVSKEAQEQAAQEAAASEAAKSPEEGEGAKPAEEASEEKPQPSEKTEEKQEETK